MMSNDTIQAFRANAFNLRGQTVVYKVYSNTFAPKTGTVTEGSTNTTIDKALISDRASGESAMKHFRIRTADLPETPPSKTSRIEYDGKEWLIQEWSTDQTEFAYDILTKRV